MGQQPKVGGNFFKLQILAKNILNKNIQAPGHHDALEDATAIKDIYKAIEPNYIDHKIWEPIEVETQKRKTVPDCRIVIDEKRRKRNLEEELKILEVNLDPLVDPEVELLEEEDLMETLMEGIKEDLIISVGTQTHRKKYLEFGTQTPRPSVADQSIQVANLTPQNQIEVMGKIYQLEKLIFRAETGERLTLEGPI
jgi:ribosome assembly protein YihI (activator of Der GTPase)